MVDREGQEASRRGVATSWGEMHVRLCEGDLVSLVRKEVFCFYFYFRNHCKSRTRKSPQVLLMVGQLCPENTRFLRYDDSSASSGSISYSVNTEKTPTTPTIDSCVQGQAHITTLLTSIPEICLLYLSQKSIP